VYFVRPVIVSQYEEVKTDSDILKDIFKKSGASGKPKLPESRPTSDDPLKKCIDDLLRSVDKGAYREPYSRKSRGGDSTSYQSRSFSGDFPSERSFKGGCSERDADPKPETINTKLNQGRQTIGKHRTVSTRPDPNRMPFVFDLSVIGYIDTADIRDILESKGQPIGTEYC
jgi:hypothetical protein